MQIYIEAEFYHQKIKTVVKTLFSNSAPPPSLHLTVNNSIAIKFIICEMQTLFILKSCKPDKKSEFQDINSTKNNINK